MKRFLPLLLLFVCLKGFSQTVDLKPYDNFLKSHVSSKGVVDFDKVLKNLDDLNKITINFSKISPNRSWSKNEIKAYWINFYNANILKLLAENYPIKSINYIRDAFSSDVIDYNGGKISLDFIEHKIIRTLDDPRIHFALYATTISSPVLKRSAYKVEDIENELRTATVNFLNDPTKNRIGSVTSKISKVFEWYSEDFGGLEGIKTFIKKYKGEMTQSTNITYMEYNWNLQRK